MIKRRFKIIPQVRNALLVFFIAILFSPSDASEPAETTELSPWNQGQISIFQTFSSNSIAQAEYFLDTDPGQGSGSTLSVTLVNGLASVNSDITLPDLTDGNHMFYLRFYDDSTGWGPPRGISFLVSGQSTETLTISSAEYYFDTDPGLGSGTTISAPVDGTYDESLEAYDFSPTLSGLNTGQHWVYLRQQSSDGNWGPARGISFLVSEGQGQALTIMGAEYYFNSDPGAGLATTISAPTDGAYDESSEEFDFDPNISGLAEGNHFLYLRLQDSESSWGPARGITFIVSGSAAETLFVAGAEYFIDTDPGVGLANAINSSIDGVFDELTEEFDIPAPLEGLSEGRHWVYLRLQHSDGSWGPERGISFMVSEQAQPTIAAAEYFFGTDPGTGNGTPLDALDGAFNDYEEDIEIDVSIPTTGLDVGTHNVYVRFQNSLGDWGDFSSRSFSIVVKPTIEISVTSLDFGTVLIGDSTQLEFVLRNLGDADLDVTNIQSPSGFSTNWISGIIVPGDSVFVTATFTPVNETTYSGNIVISNNDAQKTIAVSGTGSTIPVSQITISPSSPYDFGAVDIFTEISKTTLITITNTGTAKLWIDSISTSNDLILNHDFLSMTDSVNIYENFTFNLTFSPRDTIDYSEYFSIYNNSPDSNYQYEILGKGVGSFAPSISAFPDSMSFGTVQVGYPIQNTLTVVNNGTITLELSEILSSNNVFSTDLSAINNSVAPGDSNKISVTFNPTDGSSYIDTLMIYSNDTPHSPMNIYVDGIGSTVPVPNIIVSSDKLNFGNIELSQSATNNLIISNIGTAPLSVTSISADQNAFTTDFSSSQTIAAGNSMTVQVTFQPSVSQVYSALLTIQNDDPDQSVLTVDLTGSSVFPEIFILNRNLHFGDVAVTQSADLVLAIENNGSDTLKISNFEHSPEIADIITITPVTYIINPNASKSFLVTFSPDSPIEYIGTISVINNDHRDTVNITGTGIDATPPDITYNPTSLENAGIMENSAIEISAGITDNNSIDWVRLMYRQGGKAEYDSVEMSLNGNYFSGAIPQAYVTRRGVEYYIMAYDGANISTIPNSAPEKPAVIRITIPDLPPITFTPELYDMISVPSELKDKMALSVLEPILGEYNIDNWRLFRWINGAYVELSDNPNFSFDPGKAYWLVTGQQEVISMDTSISVKTNENYIISLDQGWNQVGTPFYFPIDWINVSNESANVMQGQVAFEYDGTGWIQANQIQPFKGYVVYTPLGGNILKFPPIESGQTAGRIQSGLAVAENEWTIRLSIRSGKLHDRDNFVGVRLHANDEWDIGDQMNPPLIGDKYVNLYFNNDHWPTVPGKYAGDFKHISKTGHLWDFTLLAKNTDDDINIDIVPINALPAGFDIFLIDKNNQTAQKIIDLSTITLNRATTLNKTFRLIVGTEDYFDENNMGIELLPTKFRLAQNYPNPFNPVTTISFDLPGETNVTLSVYNALGQKVIDIISNEQISAGYHHVIWNGYNQRAEKAASGVYFYILQTDRFKDIKKMVLIK